METVYGSAGTSTWTVAVTAIDVEPGETLFMPRGAVDGSNNRSGQVAACLCILTPGLLGPDYFREAAALVAAGLPDPDDMKRLMMRRGLVPVGHG